MKKRVWFVCTILTLLLLCACGKTTEIVIDGGKHHERNTALNSAMRYPVFYSCGDGKLHAGKPDGDVIESDLYEGNGDQLTLKGLKLAFAGTNGLILPDDTKIVIEPGTENTIVLESDRSDASAYAVDALGDIEISGGKLEIKCLGTCDIIGCINARSDLHLNNTRLVLTSAPAPQGSYGIYAEGALTANASSLSVTSGDAAYPYCIVCSSFTSDGSDIVLKSGKSTENTVGISCCIFSEGDINLVSGSWSFECGKAEERLSMISNSGAIFGDLNIEGFESGVTNMIYN